MEKARTANTDFRYRIWNADGGEVEQCGNGARCFARFVRDGGLTTKTAIRVETASGVIVPEIQPSGQVSVDMGAPRFAPRDVPFDASEERLTYLIEVAGERIEVCSDGQPACSASGGRRDRAPVTTQGPLIENQSSRGA